MEGPGIIIDDWMVGKPPCLTITRHDTLRWPFAGAKNLSLPLSRKRIIWLVEGDRTNGRNDEQVPISDETNYQSEALYF